MHVDDFTHCGTSSWYTAVISKLAKCFKISRTGSGSFGYVRLNVVQTKDAVQVDQHDYVRDLEPLHLTPERSLD